MLWWCLCELVFVCSFAVLCLFAWFFVCLFVCLFAYLLVVVAVIVVRVVSFVSLQSRTHLLPSDARSEHRTNSSGYTCLDIKITSNRICSFT